MKIQVLPVLMTLVFLTAACAGGAAPIASPEPTDPPVPVATASEAAAQDPVDESGGQTATVTSLQLAILPDNSEARFYIDEVLRGEPTRVEGITQHISGGVTIESLDPLAVSLQSIEIDAGTFVTDNSFRNRAISEAILQSGRYPTITFVPTSIEGLPENAEPGETYSFEITGDLTIREITQPVTFRVTLNAESAESITGSASAAINRADFNLRIPSVPQVADVSEQVLLEFDFSATRTG